MKTILILYLLFIHVFLGIVITKTDAISRVKAKLGIEITSSEFTPHYHTMLGFHKRVDKNVLDKSVIFIGDSLTQGLAVTAVFPKAVNFGIGQDTTLGVIKRIPFYPSILRSNMVVIAIGINDLKRRNNNEIVRNYLKIIDLLPKNIPVLFSAILPIDESEDKKIGINDRIHEINARLNNVCASNPKLHFLDISQLLVDSFGNLSSDYHIGDGVHLNDLGNKIWISKLKEYHQLEQ